jgi:tetratricopeptide (TPR) repeat protein
VTIHLRKIDLLIPGSDAMLTVSSARLTFDKTLPFEKMKLEWLEKHLSEAEQMMYKNRVQEGLSLMHELLYDEPGYGYLHNHLGWAYLYYTKETDKAEQHLKLAAKFLPEYAAPYQHLGTLYTRAGRYDEALEVLARALTKSAYRVAILEGMANAYELKREYSKAIRTYKEALTSTVGAEVAQLTEGIKRCRKKRWVMMFTF